MGFTKRKKQFALYRGANPDPTAEEVRNKRGTHVGRVEFVTPDPTPYQRALARGEVKKIRSAPVDSSLKPSKDGPQRRANAKRGGSK